jgi:CDP-glucose 4,6-dehydratase
MISKEFWKNKKVLITGHTGFKGSWLVKILQMLGAEVIGYSKDIPTHPSLYESLKLKDQLQAEKFADVCETEKLSAFMKEGRPDLIFHLAAQSLVRKSYHNPLETFLTNAQGTASLLEAVRMSQIKPSAVLIVTTDKCYENQEHLLGYKESDKLGGHDPYSASKACAEIITNSYRLSFFNSLKIPVASARAGNVIGGGDWAEDRIIPDLVRFIIDKKTPVLRNPLAIRPWQHVMEPLAGYLELAQTIAQDQSKCGAYNFGPFEESEKNVREVAEFFLTNLGQSSKWNQDEKFSPHEATLLKLNIEKAINQLGWKPKLSFEKGLNLTAEWYAAHLKNGDLNKLTEEQISRYFFNG